MKRCAWCDEQAPLRFAASIAGDFPTFCSEACVSALLIVRDEKAGYQLTPSGLAIAQLNKQLQAAGMMQNAARAAGLFGGAQ